MMNGADESKRLRVLVVDDEVEILKLYERILCPDRIYRQEESTVGSIQSAASIQRPQLQSSSVRFEVTLCNNGLDAVQQIQQSIDSDSAFALAFIDVRMPDGPDGVWVAEQIRALDPYINIIMMTGYADVDAMDIADHVPPADKLLYLQKPINPQEILQFTMALGSKWNVEWQLRRICSELRTRVEERTAELVQVNEELNEANRILQRLTITDDLTKLYNKRYFNKEIAEWVEYSKRHGIPLSLLMFDIDRFKQYNDTYGHQAGDDVLEQIGMLVKHSLRRQGDTPFSGIESGCRFGGEEFAIVLPRTDLKGAVAVAGRLREFVENDTKVTISVGVAQLGRDEVTDEESLIRKADINLYKAKELGRNRVYWDE
ncbi:MAG TPA: diguanylate cyclase [bacterium]|nr:diguanylate cyclase [bacterium]